MAKQLEVFHKEALKIHELSVSLENISNDDRRDVADYSRDEIKDEAEYVLSTFHEGGHCNNDDLNDPDQETRRSAALQVKQLERLIKKLGRK